MAVERIRDGLWRWVVPHPAWHEGVEWERLVGCVYYEAPGAVVVIDPLVPSDGADRDRFWRALDRDVERMAVPVVVLLTCRWHVRSAVLVRDRYGARLVAPAADEPYLAGVTTETVGDGEWPVEGVQAFATGMPAPEEEVLYWIPEHRALVAGDVLLGGPAGLRVAPPSWFDDSDAERRWYRDGLGQRLARLRDLGPDLVLTAHGEPVRAGARRALERALVLHPGSP